MRFKNKLLHNLRREASYKKEDLRRDWGDEFYECIKDIAEHPVVLRMKLYPHHGHTSCSLITTMSGADFFSLMRGRPPVEVCFTTCFYMIGIHMLPGPETIFME